MDGINALVLYKKVLRKGETNGSVVEISNTFFSYTMES